MTNHMNQNLDDILLPDEETLRDFFGDEDFDGIEIVGGCPESFDQVGWSW